jgi:type III restriction enzyme
VLKEEVKTVVDQLLSRFTTFTEGTVDTVGTAESASAVIKVNDKAVAAQDPEWTDGGHTNPVRLRWLLSLAIRSLAPQASKIIAASDPKFDVRVQVRSNAEAAVKDLAEKISQAYFEHSELIYEDSDPFVFGPMRVVKDGAIKFNNSLYPQYGKMGTEEAAFARGLDSANVIWHRNPVSGGYSIPLLTPGDTANFFPDFLAWKGSKVFAIDTKGKHLLTEALLRKMFDINDGDKSCVRVRFVVKGKQETLNGRTVTKDGYTIWRVKNNQLVAIYKDTMTKAVDECLK